MTIVPRLIHALLNTHTSLHPKWHLDHFSQFSKTRGRDQHTDRWMQHLYQRPASSTSADNAG